MDEKTKNEQPAKADATALPLNHPLAKVFGSRRGDPTLDRLEQGIALYRRRIARQEKRSETSK